MGGKFRAGYRVGALRTLTTGLQGRFAGYGFSIRDPGGWRETEQNLPG